ncbi:hypothetical protein F2P56_019848 [Juglans regia]|uniref:Uncharacterized protein LOC108981453 n=2 Tax=Juglans regia TaxID=51240 RepID=A0A2I4DM09_JUGRE|nr:uncharacterized protein LOC108981453 [Juglans regia]KAF5459942.1 hypothetical protein F2P56_019848 [Juglans regia]
MMMGFLKKFMAAVLVGVFLLVGVLPTTSALLSSGLKGGRKSLWLVQGRDGSMKMFPREKEGGNSERVNIDSNQLLFSFGGGIRRKFIPPPPSPMRSRQSSWRMPAPPAPPPQIPS